MLKLAAQSCLQIALYGLFRLLALAVLIWTALNISGISGEGRLGLIAAAGILLLSGLVWSEHEKDTIRKMQDRKETRDERSE